MNTISEAIETLSTINALRAENERLREALAYLQSYGCPVCHGDCASANPPVICCPMQDVRAALSVDLPPVRKK